MSNMDTQAAVARVEDLDGRGQTESAAGLLEQILAASIANGNDDAKDIQLYHASFNVRKRFEVLARDPALFTKVEAFLTQFCEESEDEAENEKLSHALVLRATLYAKILGDFGEAEEDLKLSIECNPSNSDALHSYGMILDEDPNRQKEAIEVYQRVLSLDPSNYFAMNNLATLLIEASRQCNVEEREKLLANAKELLKKAQQLGPGFPAYNLACVASLRYQSASEDHKALLEQECRSWLDIAKANDGIPDQDHLAQDKDFECFRDRPWWRQIELEFRHPDLFVVPCGPGNNCVLLAAPEGKTSSPDDAPFMDDELRGTTGWTIWNASYIILQHLLKLPSWTLKGSNILDLSAGIGLLGLACAFQGAKVTMTEIGKKQLDVLTQNVELNGFTDKQVACKKFAWGNQEQVPAEHFHVVLASDLLFIGIRDGILDELEKTLHALLHRCDQIIFAFEERRPDLEKDFMARFNDAANIDFVALEPDSSLLEKLDRRGIGEVLHGLVLHEKATFKMFSISMSTR